MKLVTWFQYPRCITAIGFCGTFFLIASADASVIDFSEYFTENSLSSDWEIWEQDEGTNFSHSVTQPGDGFLHIDVSGGENYTSQAGVLYQLPSPVTEFVVTVKLAGYFGGNQGNKRGTVEIEGTSGVAYKIQLGKDMWNHAWQGEVCVPDCLNTENGRPYEDGDLVTLILAQQGSSLILELDNELLYEIDADFGQLRSLRLYASSNNNSEAFSILFDSVEINGMREKP